MSFTAYAYFSHTVTTNQAPVQSAKWGVEVVSNDEITPMGNGYFTLNNSQSAVEREFAFVISKRADSTANTGYVKIVAHKGVGNDENAVIAYTKQIGSFLENGVKVNDNDRRVVIKVAANQTVFVKFIANWGSCAKTDLIVGEDEFVLVDFGVSSNEQNNQNTLQEEPTLKADGDSGELAQSKEENSNENTASQNDFAESVTETSEGGSSEPAESDDENIEIKE